MELSTIDLLSSLAAVAGVWMCGVTLVRTMLWGLAFQTFLLGAIAALQGLETGTPNYLWLALAVIVIKAGAIPLFLGWTAARIGARRDRGAFLSPPAGLLLGCAVLAQGFLFTSWIAAATTANHVTGGMTMALQLLGMLFMLTRRLAISQVIGFLMLENGIFLYALTQTHGMPLMVEMGVLLDVLVGVMVAGLVIFRLKHSFEHIDVTELRGLRE